VLRPGGTARRGAGGSDRRKVDRQAQNSEPSRALAIERRASCVAQGRPRVGGNPALAQGGSTRGNAKGWNCGDSRQPQRQRHRPSPLPSARPPLRPCESPRRISNALIAKQFARGFLSGRADNQPPALGRLRGVGARQQNLHPSIRQRPSILPFWTAPVKHRWADRRAFRIARTPLPLPTRQAAPQRPSAPLWRAHEGPVALTGNCAVSLSMRLSTKMTGNCLATLAIQVGPSVSTDPNNRKVGPYS
jgi:hypothetical protein